MFDEIERTIRATLRGVARQRVRLVLQPGNVWVVDRTMNEGDDTEAALFTCQMRGWVEPLHHAVPSSSLTSDLRLPPHFRIEKEKTIYRLTSAGWSVIHRSYQLANLALLTSMISLAISIASVLHLFGSNAGR